MGEGFQGQLIGADPAVQQPFLKPGGGQGRSAGAAEAGNEQQWSIDEGLDATGAKTSRRAALVDNRVGAAATVKGDGDGGRIVDYEAVITHAAVYDNRRCETVVEDFNGDGVISIPSIDRQRSGGI